MLFSPTRRGRCFVNVCIVSAVLAIVLPAAIAPPVTAEELVTTSPELKLGLRDAIQAAVDNNVNVRLLKERIG